MNLHPLFYPQSIAVIGASTKQGTVGNEVAKNVAQQGYQGKVYFINPKGGELYGHTVLKSLDEMLEPVDVAVIAIPAAMVLEEVKKLQLHAVKAVVVISAGFKEVGNTKAELELAAYCQQENILLIGPNCLGFLNPELKLNASFAPLMPLAGDIAFISQSGALCASVLDYAKTRHLGFSKFISLGNKAVIDEAAMLDYLQHDEQTKVIALYAEELSHSEKLRHIASTLTQGNNSKPIIILKAGKTSAGQKAAQSHTGSLSGSDDAYQALFKQSGIIRADTIDELFNLLVLFSRQKKMAGSRVAVITNAGGPGVLTADAVINSGLQLAELNADSKKELESALPCAASVKNPIDVLGDAPASRYSTAIEVALADPQVDAVQVILTPQSMTEIKETAAVIVSLSRTAAKPVVATFLGDGLVEEGIELLNQSAVITSSFPEQGAQCLATLAQFQRRASEKKDDFMQFSDLNPEAVREVFAQVRQEKRSALTLSESFLVLQSYGFPVIDRSIITSVSEATALAAQTETDVVLKIVSPDIIHKTEVGGVVLNVSPDSLVKEYQQLIQHIKSKVPKAAITGVEVMPMISSTGMEIIVGLTTDPQLGKQIVVGWGGIYTEVFRDIACGLAPLSLFDIHSMIGSLKISPILKGVRGQKAFATEVLIEALGRLSQLALDFPEIKELDINPLILGQQKKISKVVDARIIL